MAIISKIRKKTKNLFDVSNFTNGTKVNFNNIDCLLVQETADPLEELSCIYTVTGDSFVVYTFTFKVYRNPEEEDQKFVLKRNQDVVLENIVHEEVYSVNVCGGDRLYFFGSGLDVYIDLTVTQLEKGLVATPFEPQYIEITQLNQKPISNITVNGVDYHFAKQSESTDGVCKHAVEEPIIDLKIGGNSVQGGEPTPENPVEVESVGVKTKNLLDYNELYTAGKIEIIDNGIRLSSYSHATTITPEKFLAMTGLKEGDQIVTSFNKKIIEGTINTYFGVFMFYKKSAAVEGTQNFYLVRSGVQHDQEATAISSVIPTGFNSTNFQTLTIYGGFIPEGGTVSTFEITNIQIEKNSVKTDFEPYGYKIPIKVNDTITYIYAKEPLRKIGDYADYIDYKNKRVIRNTGSYTFIGTESAVLKYSTEEKYNYETTTTASASILKTVPMCNYLKGVSGNMSSTSIPLNHIRWSGYNGAYNIVVAQPTAAEMKAWLTSLIYEGNPMKIFYVLKTPVEEDIEIPEIITEKGTNNFSIDTIIAPSELKINYWKQIGVE